MPSPWLMTLTVHLKTKPMPKKQGARCLKPGATSSIFLKSWPFCNIVGIWMVHLLFGMVKMPLCLQDHILECLPKKLWKISWLNQGKWEDAEEYFLARVPNFTKISKVHSNMNKKVRENNINFPWAEDMRPSENIKMLYLFQQMWSEVAFDGKSNPMIGLKLFSLPRLNIL